MLEFGKDCALNLSRYKSASEKCNGITKAGLRGTCPPGYNGNVMPSPLGWGDSSHLRSQIYLFIIYFYPTFLPLSRHNYPFHPLSSLYSFKHSCFQRWALHLHWGGGDSAGTGMPCCSGATGDWQKGFLQCCLLQDISTEKVPIASSSRTLR